MLYTLEGKLKKQNKVLKYLSMLGYSILWGLLGTVIIALIIGFRPIIINGGSMLPTLDYNDIIVIYKPPQEEIHVGDILTFTFSESSTYITHRIIAIDENGDYWTEGDNPNNSPDGYPISYNKEKANKPYVVGKTYYSLKVVGQTVAWLRDLPNLFSTLLGIVLLVQSNKAIKTFVKENAENL